MDFAIQDDPTRLARGRSARVPALFRRCSAHSSLYTLYIVKSVLCTLYIVQKCLIHSIRSKSVLYTLHIVKKCRTSRAGTVREGPSLLQKVLRALLLRVRVGHLLDARGVHRVRVPRSGALGGLSDQRSFWSTYILSVLQARRSPVLPMNQ